MVFDKIEEISGYYVVEGPLKVKVLNGEAEITGRKLKPGEEAIVPLAKATLVESPSKAEVQLRGSGKVTKLESSTIPSEWKEVLDSLTDEIRTVFIVGSIDSGKTFFTTYLANKLLERGLKVSVVDCDVGQSDIGPPTTIGLGTLNNQVTFLDEVGLVSAYFIGSTSPAGHLLPMVVGTTKLVEEGKKSSDLVLVDTPGMVFGGPARAYQQYAIEALNPSLIIALQKSDELKHLITQFKALSYEVLELPSSKWVKQRDRSDRKVLRERAFSNYFSKKGISRKSIELNGVSLVGSFLGSGSEASRETVRIVESMIGCRVDYCEISRDSIIAISSRRIDKASYQRIREAFSDKIVKILARGFEKGIVVGLLGDKGRFLDIGVMEKLDLKAKKVTISTPLEEIDRVKAVKMGCIRLDDEYHEIERLEPGYI